MFIVFSPLLSVKAIKETIAFENPEVIASSTDTASILFILPQMFSLIFICFTPVICLLENKCPIVGQILKSKQYSSFKKEFIPFIKNLWLDLKNSKILKTTICITLVSLLLVGFSFFDRTSIMEDHSITRFSIFNQSTAKYTIDDYSELEINAFYSSGKYGTRGYSITIHMSDGKCFTFRNVNLNSDRNYTLDKMLEIKFNLSSNFITVSGIDKMEKYVNGYDFTKEQENKIRELFSN